MCDDRLDLIVGEVNAPADSSDAPSTLLEMHTGAAVDFGCNGCNPPSSLGKNTILAFFPPRQVRSTAAHGSQTLTYSRLLRIASGDPRRPVNTSSAC